MSRCCHSIQRLCSLSSDRAVAAPNLCAAASYGSFAGARRWVYACNSCFPFWAPKTRHIKKQSNRRGVGLGRPPFGQKNQDDPTRRGTGRTAGPPGTAAGVEHRGGGCCFFVQWRQIKQQKKEKEWTASNSLYTTMKML
jgi:hypothetical protein